MAIPPLVLYPKPDMEEGKKIIAICQCGGEFETEKDGSLSYVGGDAHAIDVDDQMKFNDFKMEVAEMFNFGVHTIYFKYFLPGNKKTLITVSNDKDLQRMIKYHGDSATIDIYIILEEIFALDISNMPASRSSRTTLSEALPPVNLGLDIMDSIMDNPTQSVILLDNDNTPLDVQLDDHIEFPTGNLPVLPPAMPNEVGKHAKGAQQWQDTITGVGQRFSGVHEFRESLRQYAIAHQFAFKYKKNDSHRVTVKCKAEGCPWRIHASRLSTTQLICIKKMNPDHTCDGVAVTTGHQATRSWGLKESIAEIFEGSYHGYCLRYLTEQLLRDVKAQFSHEVKKIIIEDFHSAAYVARPESFHRCIEGIKTISPEAYNWILLSEPQNWANAFFQGARYNHVMSNFGEIFYSWASEANELPITQMVDLVRGKISELLYARRADSDQWVSRLTPTMEEKIEKESLKNRPLHVLLSAGSTFEVRGDTIEVVDVENWDCSCKVWQFSGLPCCHALAVIDCIAGSPYDYCSRYLTTELYRLTYSEVVHPIPNVDSSEASVTVTPPSTRRPPGRPVTKKVGSVMKRQLQCSKCKGLGHNKSTCKEM
ncbi:hypothetical protein ACFE04_027608 [Oxalis oulophora]